MLKGIDFNQNQLIDEKKLTNYLSINQNTSIKAVKNLKNKIKNFKIDVNYMKF